MTILVIHLTDMTRQQIYDKINELLGGGMLKALIPAEIQSWLLEEGVSVADATKVLEDLGSYPNYA